MNLIYLFENVSNTLSCVNIRNIVAIFNIFPSLCEFVDFAFELLGVIRELFAHLKFKLSVYFINIRSYAWNRDVRMG